MSRRNGSAAGRACATRIAAGGGAHHGRGRHRRLRARQAQGGAAARRRRTPRRCPATTKSRRSCAPTGRSTRPRSIRSGSHELRRVALRGDARARALQPLPHRPGAQGHRRAVRRDRPAALPRELQGRRAVPAGAQHRLRRQRGAPLLRRPRARGERCSRSTGRARRCDLSVFDPRDERVGAQDLARPAGSWSAPGSRKSARWSQPRMTPGRREALILGAAGVAAAAAGLPGRPCSLLRLGERRRRRSRRSAGFPDLAGKVPQPWPSGAARSSCATSGRPGARPAARRSRCWSRPARNMAASGVEIVGIAIDNGPKVAEFSASFKSRIRSSWRRPTDFRSDAETRQQRGRAPVYRRADRNGSWSTASSGHSSRRAGCDAGSADPELGGVWTAISAKMPASAAKT